MARRAFRAASLAAVCLLAALSASNACIYLFGSSPDSIAAHPAGTPWNHGFLGDDWEGQDGAGTPWVCKTGKKQSPINVQLTQLLGKDDATPVPPAHQTRWSYPDLVSNGSNIEVINNGHTIQVEWRSPYAARVRIPIPAKPTNTTPITAVLTMDPTERATTVEAVPLQFHLHSHSEHTVDGQQYPLELHIVHRITDPKLPACAGGCFAVIGLLFELSDGPDNALLKTIWENMPMREGEILRPKAGSRISLGRLLPPAAERNYVTYEGSLTTPPCSEGLLWHVLTTPQKISVKQWRQYLRAVGLKDCASKNGTATYSNRRALLAEGGNPDDYNCTVGAYGFNYRIVQPVNGRVVRSARVCA